MSNILSFLLKIRYKENIFAVKPSERPLKVAKCREEDDFDNVDYVMLDAFLNATEGSNSLSRTTPPECQNFVASRLSTVVRKYIALKQYSTTQLKTRKVRDTT
jgi:hypothetical protein